MELSIENGFEKGSVVEVRFNEDTYWIASVVTPCGQLLGLKFVDKWQDTEEEVGDDEDELETVDKWCDAFSAHVHPLGWCKQNNKILQPPKR